MQGLLAAAVAALVIGASAPGDAPSEPAGSALPDEQLAGARVISGFPGHHPPKGLRRMISAGLISGVILFDGNAGSRSSVRSLTAELQSIPRPAGSPPLLIAVDQEGGLVRRLPGPPKPSARSIGAQGAGVATKVGRATGKSLRSMGVNVDLAPVLDLGRPGRAIFEEGRTFARKPGAVSRIGVGFARGLAAGGVAATAKHFPGLGDARVNTDNAVQRIRLPAKKLRRVDERPYVSFIPAGGAMVMLSTAIYPALSKKPAALSRAVATGELRDRLGFRGVSITDALGTVSARVVGGPASIAIAAARAGTDLVLYTDLGSASKAQDALQRALAAGSLDRPEFEASVSRVMGLRAGLPR